MQIDITRLLTNQVNTINFDNDVNIPQEYLKDSRIDNLENIKTNGKISLDEENNLIINANLTGTMILKDDVTLEPVTYHFATDFEENIDNHQNLLDITDILWQNILV